MNIQRIYFLYLCPEGRISRFTMAAGLTPLLLAGVAVYAFVPMTGPSWFFIDSFLFMFAMVLAVKRLFDRGRPDWFLFLGLSPVAWLVIALDPKIYFSYRNAQVGLALFMGWLTLWLAVELFVLPGRSQGKTRPAKTWETGKTGLADGIDDFVDVIGRVVAWITIAQVVLVAMDVILRYLFRIGPMDLQELEWHLISPIALIGMCYAQRHGDHVKVDIVYERFPEKTKNIIDLFAAIITITVSVLIIYFAVGFVDQAYVIDEGSPDPGGLPHRWLLRSFIPVGFAILTMQALSNLLRTCDRLSRQSSTTANGE